MNFKHIENLVKLSRNNNEKAKEDLLNEFRPMILNICKNTFISGYDFYDLRNECYATLLKCLHTYNIDSHKFVAYATNSIQNNIKYLIKKSKRRSSSEGTEALILSDSLEDSLVSDNPALDDALINTQDYNALRNSLTHLNEKELDLINFVFIQNNPVALYAKKNRIKYTTAICRKNVILSKLKTIIAS